MRIADIVITAFLLAPGLLPAQTVRLEAEDAKMLGPNLHVVHPGIPDADTAKAVPAPTQAAGQAEALGPNHDMTAGYSGTGYVAGFNSQDDRLTFTYQAAKAGAYDVHIGYRSKGQRGYELEVNGLTLSGLFHPSATGKFEVQNVGRVALNAGANTLTVSRGWRFYDIDFLEITPAGPINLPAKVNTPPVDSLATPEARALLKRLDDTYGHGVFMGADSDPDTQYILDTTGFRPAIMEGDLSPYSPASVERGHRESHTTDKMIAYGQEGYMVTMCWHWVSPFGLYNRKLPAENGKPPVDLGWYSGFYTKSTNFDVSIAMGDPQSVERTYLIRDIDAIAVQLKKFQAANVPVLWRPLHEGQGGWFWWGAKGPEPFVALWRLMYDRLVNVDGIHNLVWVFTSGDDPAWYPGDAYVDVVGIDAYPKDLRDPQSELWVNLIQQFDGKKPLAIPEFGGVPDIQRMHALGNDWVYAVPWNGVEGPRKNDPQALKDIYASPLALKLPAPAKQPAATAPLTTPATTPPASQ